MLKRWHLFLLLGIAGCGVAYAATDAFFAGRALRMTKTAAATCSNAAYNCEWFDTSNRQRFWNGTTSLYTVDSTDGTQQAGKVLYSNGTNWVTLAPGNSKQALVTQVTDGGVKQLRWVSPTDGGLVLP